MGNGFTSDQLAALFREARRQGFIELPLSKNGHAYLRCRRCPVRFSFTTTGNGSGRVFQNQVADLRRHGLLWQGRGGTHRADIPHENRKKERTT